MKVFLSRNKPSEALVIHAQKLAWELTWFSCIRKSLITREGPPEADWIFFYSPSAVEMFFENFGDYRAKWAALGEGTARIFRERGIEPDFVGKSPDTSQVMREFKGIISAEERVVQARGETSFERLREVLKAEQIIDWPFYRSEPKNEIPSVEADVYIFTSPSNAEAYLAKQTLPDKVVAVVFGESTKSALQAKSSILILVTDEPGEESSIQRIEAHLEGL
ncbi:uroporphyrinogen-III synthase [Cryomorphaceae bacterium 1068]|nr:uroporphyrinogen-III synthase [Cryomorphaceae bacterium 1068]